MFSFTKVILLALYCSALSAVVSAKKQSINDGGGGAGGGSERRNNNKAVNTGSATSAPPPTASYNAGGSSNFAGSTSSSTSITSGYDITSITPSTPIVSTTPSIPTTSTVGSGSSNSGATNNFSTGTLAQRPSNLDIKCPICMAGDHSIFESNKVNVGEGKMWTCGYLQETVQDVDGNSPWESERQGCANAQHQAEMGGCCPQNVRINQPGMNPNDPCALCDGLPVPASKQNELVNTQLVGTHTCSGLAMVMQQGIFSASMCPAIKQNTKSFCCNAAAPAISRSANFLRGAASAP